METGIRLIGVLGHFLFSETFTDALCESACKCLTKPLKVKLCHMFVSSSHVAHMLMSGDS